MFMRCNIYRFYKNEMKGSFGNSEKRIHGHIKKSVILLIKYLFEYKSRDFYHPTKKYFESIKTSTPTENKRKVYRSLNDLF